MSRKTKTTAHCYVIYDSSDENTQLPRYVADTIEELSEESGVSYEAIKKGLHRRSPRYRRIDFDTAIEIA